jgi:hypothetical protein
LVALPADRAKAGILVDNYGEASAVNVYRPDVPIAVSVSRAISLVTPRGPVSPGTE